MKEAIPKGLRIAWFHSYDLLENTKPEGQRTNPWFPETGTEERRLQQKQ